MWPPDVKEQAMVSCGRRCCLCHKYCGTNIECHHIVPESQGGASTSENAIPLCFDCHAEVEHYNVQHPKGTKFTPNELRKHQDRWYKAVETGSLGEPPSSESVKLDQNLFSESSENSERVRK
jgi:HNH endonuclease